VARFVPQVVDADEQVGSPCSLSGSDGSTATAEALFGGGDIDSPMSVEGDEALYMGCENDQLSLSDVEFDAVMEGIAGPNHFGELDIGEYDFITLAGPVNPLPPVAVRPGQRAGGGKDKAPKQRKPSATKVQGGVTKAEKRAKARGAVVVAAAAAADKALQSMTDLLSSELH
jgi:hypothetical protein